MDGKSNIGKDPVGEGTGDTENRGSSLQLNPNLAKLRERWRERKDELPLMLRRGVPANPEQSTSSPAGHVEPIREDPRVTRHETSMNIQGGGLPLRRQPAGPVQVHLQDSGSTEAPGVGKVDTAYYEVFVLSNASIHDAYTKLLGSPRLDDSLRGKISRFAKQIKDLDVQYSVSYLFTKFDPLNDDQVLRLAVYSGPAAELVRNMTDLDSLSRFRDDVERALNTVNTGISESQTGIDSRVLEFARESFNNLLGKVDERLRYLSPTHGDGVPGQELPNAIAAGHGGGTVNSVKDNGETAGGPTESIFDSPNSSVSSVYGEQQGDPGTKTDDNQQTSHGDRGVVQAGPVEPAGVGSVEFTGAELAEPVDAEPVEPTDTEPVKPAGTESVGPTDDTYPKGSTNEVVDGPEAQLRELEQEFLSEYRLLGDRLRELNSLRENQRNYLEMIRGIIGGDDESLPGLGKSLNTTSLDLRYSANVLSARLEQAPDEVKDLVYRLLGPRFSELSSLASSLSIIGENIDSGSVEDYDKFNNYSDGRKAGIRETLDSLKNYLRYIVNSEGDFLYDVKKGISSGCDEKIIQEILPRIYQTEGVIAILSNNLKVLEDYASYMQTPSADVPQLPELSLPSQGEEPNSSHGEPDSSYSILSNDLQTVVGIVDQVLGDSDLSISEKWAIIATIQTEVEAAGNLLVDTQSGLGQLDGDSILTDGYSINNKFREIIRQAIQNAFENTLLSSFITRIKYTDWESVFDAFPYQIGSYRDELARFMNFDSVPYEVADIAPWINNQTISEAITTMRGLADGIRSKLAEISDQLGMFQSALEMERTILDEITQIQYRLRNMQYRLQELQDNGQQTQENQDTSHE